MDENKVITVFFGSESPGKNGKSVAEELCAKIKAAGFHVETGGPVNLDTIMGSDRLTAPAEEGGPRKKAIAVLATGSYTPRYSPTCFPGTPLKELLVVTAGVGEFPDGSKGFVKEAFGAKIEHDYESKPIQLSQSGLDLSNVDFAVFGLGDTNYHPAEKHLTDSYGSPWTYCTPA